MTTSTVRGVRRKDSECGGVAGCEEDPWAGAEAPALSWIGATRSDIGVGQEDMLSTPPRTDMSKADGESATR